MPCFINFHCHLAMWLAPLKSGKRRDLLWQREGLGLHGRLDANARTRFSKKKEKGEEKLGGLAIEECGVLGEAKWKYCQG